MNLNKLRDKAYQCAVAHGWHEENLSDEHFLCLVISELMEAVEADRKGMHANRANFEYYMKQRKRDDGEFMYAFKYGIKDSVEDELSDACIRLLDLAGLRNIDLTFADDLITCGEYQKTNKSLTELIYHLCGLLSSKGEDLKDKINYAIAIIIYYCDEERNIDLLWYIEQKMKYNELRPYKHGDKSY